MKIVIGLIVGVIIINLVILDVKMLATKEEKTEDNRECPAECDQKIETAIARMPTPETRMIEVTVTETKKPVTEVKRIKSTSYLPIPGNGSSGTNNWASLEGTEFYLDSGDYPGLKEARLEANVRLINGNGIAYARLFDKTSGIEVWGSEIQTKSQKFETVISERLTLRPGNRLYEVQAKSLTADTAVFNSGRIKLVSEN